MIQEALGLIEVIGFVPALEAADACVKSANVKFIGYEKVTGGLVTVKIQGDVGAVKAAIEAGRSSAERIGTVISTLVIPRPALGIQSFIHLSEEVLSEQPEEQTSGTIEAPEQLFSLKEVAVSHEETAVIEDSLQNTQDGAEEIVNDEVPTPESDLSQTAGSEDGDEPVHTKGKEEKKATCNLCGDPKCSREKGMPRNLCIHYKENN